MGISTSSHCRSVFVSMLVSPFRIKSQRSKARSRALLPSSLTVAKGCQERLNPLAASRLGVQSPRKNFCHAPPAKIFSFLIIFCCCDTSLILQTVTHFSFSCDRPAAWIVLHLPPPTVKILLDIYPTFSLVILAKIEYNRDHRMEENAFGRKGRFSI